MNESYRREDDSEAKRSDPEAGSFAEAIELAQVRLDDDDDIGG